MQPGLNHRCRLEADRDRWHRPEVVTKPESAAGRWRALHSQLACTRMTEHKEGTNLAPESIGNGKGRIPGDDRPWSAATRLALTGQ